MSILVQQKPITPGQRGMVKLKRDGLYKGRPEKKLTAKLNRKAGRNNTGSITVRHRGGGHKKLYRIIDFKRIKDGMTAKVERIEYDPNRTSHIALICYSDGTKSYIIAPKGLQVGNKIQSGIEAPISMANCLPLENIPVGTTIYCIELKPGKGAQLVRSAGNSAQLVAKEGVWVTIRMPSGEMRKIHAECRACVGEVGNQAHNLINLGKAGATRWRGIRPTVRGVAMNPVDHPHGGGEGRTSGGRHPVTPWGKPTKGYKTRKNKLTSKFIVRRRKSKK